MSEPLVQSVLERFHAYARGFLGNEEGDFAYSLKIRHTDEVSSLADAICKEEILPEHVKLAARLAAVLHDVGRFPQYRQFRSFRDRETANHALLSVRHLLRENMLEGVPAGIRKLVLGAVFLHNVRELPTGLPSDLLQTVRIVRDADKLDIMRVMVKHFTQEGPEHAEVSLAAKPSPTEYTPEVYDLVMARQASDYRMIVWHNDFKLMILGWMYDFNFRSSLALLRSLGHYLRLFDLLPDCPPIHVLRDQLLNDLAKRLEHA